MWHVKHGPFEVGSSTTGGHEGSVITDLKDDDQPIRYQVSRSGIGFHFRMTIN